MDKENQNNLWNEWMEREIKDIDAHNIFIPNDNKESIPKVYKFIPVYIVFHVKYDGKRKAKWVSWGHLTNIDTSKLYSGVISIEHVRLILL